MNLFIAKDSAILTTWGTKYIDRQKLDNLAVNDPAITFTAKELTLTGWPDTSFTQIRLNIFNFSGTRIANGINGDVFDFKFNQTGSWVAQKK